MPVRRRSSRPPISGLPCRPARISNFLTQNQGSLFYNEREDARLRLIRRLHQFGGNPTSSGPPRVERLDGWDREPSKSQKGNRAIDFFRLLDKKHIRWSDLDNLSDFCPCALKKNKPERSLLLDLFLARSDAYRSSEAAVVGKNKRMT